MSDVKNIGSLNVPKISIELLPLTDEEKQGLAGQMTPLELRDLAIMQMAPIGPLQVGSAPDGTMFISVTYPVPPGFFTFQKTGGLVGADGKPVFDVSSGIVSSPIGRVLIKKSGISEKYRAMPQLKDAFEPELPNLIGVA
jgi:hypothetical protein